MTGSVAKVCVLRLGNSSPLVSFSAELVLVFAANFLDKLRRKHIFLFYFCQMFSGFKNTEGRNS